MALTGQHVRDALASVGALGGQMRTLDVLAVGANEALRQAPGLTVAGAAAFAGTQAQESAYFRTTQEYGKALRYDPFRGRTFEMITWESNYGSFGKWLCDRGLLQDPQTFVRNPAALADYRWAWLGGVWFFQVNGLWRYANAGNFLAVSQAVNGGNGRIGTKFIPNGWDHRQRMYNAFLRVGDALLPGASAPVANNAGPESLPSLEYGMRNNVHVASLQRFSNQFPWRPALPLLPISGNYLDDTARVLAAAAVQMGIRGADGRNIGPQYKQQLWSRGWRG